MDELIRKLLNEEGKLSLHLIEAKEFAEQAKDEDLIEFIDDELNGYSKKDLPEYRKIRGEIIGVIKDAYGRVVRQGEPINFSKLSEHLGFELAEAHIPDGINFVETGLEGLEGNIVERPIPHQLVEMLNKTFKHNNPHLTLTSASHQFAKASLQYILSKVRQDLIIGLRKIKNQKDNSIKDIANVEPANDSKTVFVTYAWESEDHNDKVISFVDFLRKKGYDASMDKKESQEQSATDFNEMMINGIQNSNKVIVVLSKKYKEKADQFNGGVGFEYKIILEQLKKTKNKFIFTSFGSDPIGEILPTGLGNIEVIDLKEDQNQKFNLLFSKIETKSVIEFSEVSKTKVEVKVKKIKPFKL